MLGGPHLPFPVPVREVIFQAVLFPFAIANICSRDLRLYNRNPITGDSVSKLYTEQSYVALLLGDFALKLQVGKLALKLLK